MYGLKLYRHEDLSPPLRKTNHRHKSLSYMTPSIWNKLPNSSKQQKTSTRTNTELKNNFSQNKQ